MPLSFLIAVTVAGAGIIVLLAVNLAQFIAHRREGKGDARSRSLGTWAWGISLVGLLVPYLAPISLAMAVTAVRRPLIEGHPHRLARMAIANSAWALLALLVLLVVMLKTGIIRGTH